MKARVIFAAFEEDPNEVGPVELHADSVDEALDEALKRFQHTEDGGSGDLAEKHKTRSLSVGDVIVVEDEDHSGERFFEVVKVGFEETRKAAMIAFWAGEE